AVTTREPYVVPATVARRFTVAALDVGIKSNTPYEGMRLPATVAATVLRGRITARDGRVARDENGRDTP
ncbi:MAG TPA: hypothetical protein VEZ42_18935, partial [Pseudonocardia sp.]|nr:hypothetical protein [Pseudonocardia sp.]